MSRSLAAQMAAHMSWGRTVDRTARTAPGRAALEAKFLVEADGDPVRAESLKRAHFKRLAILSAESRRKKLAAELAEAEAAAVELAEFDRNDDL